MATDKSYAELKDDTKRILEKWQPILDRCGHLEELEEKLFLANTLEKLTSKAQGVQGTDYVLPDGGTLNVVDQYGTTSTKIGLMVDSILAFLDNEPNPLDRRGGFML